VDGSEPVVIFISEDPRASHRANEAMRIALGIFAGENEVIVILAGPAVHLLDSDSDGLVDGDDIARHRSALKRLAVPFHIERSSIPSCGDGWNEDGHPVVPVGSDEIAELMTRGRRFLIF
jgi:hypothetical protein